MIFSSVFLVSFFVNIINANDEYHLGIINHDPQWHIHCPQNYTQILHPPFNDQPLISYQCPYPSSSVDILPIEIDLTFICRLQPRLIWIIVDLYRYNYSSWSIDIQHVNISLEINHQFQIRDFKSERTEYKNRLILINAFYIPFESLHMVSNQTIELSIRIDQCIFHIKENSTWQNLLQNHCDETQSQTLLIQHAQCDFFPKFKPIDTLRHDNVTDVSDVNLVLSIDERQPNKTAMQSDGFEEQYRNLLEILMIVAKASHLLIWIFIVTVIILVLLILFFIYILCYHFHHRAIRKSSLLI